MSNTHKKRKKKEVLTKKNIRSKIASRRRWNESVIGRFVDCRRYLGFHRRQSAPVSKILLMNREIESVLLFSIRGIGTFNQKKEGQIRNANFMSVYAKKHLVVPELNWLGIYPGSKNIRMTVHCMQSSIVLKTVNDKDDITFTATMNLLQNVTKSWRETICPLCLSIVACMTGEDLLWKATLLMSIGYLLLLGDDLALHLSLDDLYFLHLCRHEVLLILSSGGHYRPWLCGRFASVSWRNW
uniref:Uncharacterized protein n=1 Tax=Romanomermis culicivorax TaxID=13658 RepID=A0A915L7S9_ROMCU